MKYEEFEGFVKDSLKGLSDYASSYNDEDGFFIHNEEIVQKHVSGGASGGNCWGDNAESFYHGPITQDFIPLERILTAVKPDIAYLKVKEIERMIKNESDSDHEYYGNYTLYELRTLDIRALYDKLFS